MNILLSKNETRLGYLLDPLVSNIFLGIDVVLLCLLCYFHYKIWRMVKREEKKKGQNLVKHLLKCYSVIVPITFCFTAVYINILTRYVYVPWAVSGYWFCLVFETFQHATIVYVGGFSVFVAGIKYWFIVHYAKANDFGEKCARKVFLITHLVIPFLIALLNSVSNGNIDQIFWVDHCWTYRTDTENLNSTSIQKLENFFCVNREYGVSKEVGGTLGMVMEGCLRALCGGVKVFYLMLLSNMLELIAYALIVAYLIR